jgi:hypothetical protein
MADGSYERAQRDADAVCGCYTCGRIFRFKQIEVFWDDGEIPVCPGCGLDTVVIETSDMQVTPQRLSAMRRTY